MSEQIANMLSASNEWPQSYHQIKEGDQDDEHQIRSMSNNNNNKNNKNMMMVAAKEGGGGGGGEGTRVVMEKPSQEQIQHQQQPLKCPRCDSTNTKFCYYNNYSLSQPRHFCKACKRYWTRGGTLRTVPVGGGCRKNKRIRRISTNNPNTSAPTNSSSNNSSSNISESNTFNSHQSLNPSGGGAHLMSPLLYGLPTNLAHHHASPHEAIINGFPFSSSYDNTHHQHQQHQLGGIGLGFSSAGMILGGGDYRNGYSTTPKQILHDLISNSNPSSLLSNFHGSNSNTTSTTNTTTTTTTLPTMSMSSLLTSTLHQHQHKFNFDTLFPYELDLHIKGVGSHENEGVYMKEDSVKLEGDDHPHRQCQIQNGYHQIHANHHHHHHQQQSMGESDPSILWNANNSNGNSIGVNWLDPNYSNLGSSSVPSLI